jgi:hypothetical protein
MSFKPLIFAAFAGALAIAPAMAQNQTPLGDHKDAVESGTTVIQNDATTTQGAMPGTASQQSMPPSSQTAPGQDPGTVTYGPSGPGSAAGKE